MFEAIILVKLLNIGLPGLSETAGDHRARANGWSHEAEGVPSPPKNDGIFNGYVGFYGG